MMTPSKVPGGCLALVLLAIACSETTTNDSMDAGKDQPMDASDADASDARSHELQPTTTTALDVTIGSVSRRLHRAQFGVTKEGESETLYFEAHEGGVTECPETQTPKRTMIVNGVPKGASGASFAKSDGVTIAFIDFTGDQIPDDNPTITASVATVTIVTPADRTSVEIEIEATFPQGTAKGRIHATYCESLSQ